MRIGVLASTKATDLQALIDAIEKGEVDAEISVVISNKEDAYALQRAKNHGIKAVYIESRNKEREEFDREVAEVLDKSNVDLILLIGYMRILTSYFVNKYRHRIMNIHPSLLPDFPGGMDKDVHKQVLDAGVDKTGCTLHFVDESVDEGPIIMQKEVQVEKGDTVESLKGKVQKAEQEVLVRAVRLYSEGRIYLSNNKVEIKE